MVFAATVLFVVIQFAAGLRSGKSCPDFGCRPQSDRCAGSGVGDVRRIPATKAGGRVKDVRLSSRRCVAAFVNALTLVGLSLYLFYESYERLMNPHGVDEQVMIVTAGLGHCVKRGNPFGPRKWFGHQHPSGFRSYARRRARFRGDHHRRDCDPLYGLAIH